MLGQAVRESRAWVQAHAKLPGKDIGMLSMGLLPAGCVQGARPRLSPGKSTCSSKNLGRGAGGARSPVLTAALHGTYQCTYAQPSAAARSVRQWQAPCVRAREDTLPCLARTAMSSSGEEHTRALADEVHKELVAQLQQIQYEYVQLGKELAMPSQQRGALVSQLCMAPWPCCALQ